MLELSETNACLRYLHPIRELDIDGDFLVDASHTICRILEGVSDRIMYLALLAHLFCFHPDLFFLISRHPCYCHWTNLLMRLSIPCVESRIVDSVLFTELLYRDVLRKALSLVQKPKALKIFTAVYHSSHSLNERKGIIFPVHTQYVKIDSLLDKAIEAVPEFGNRISLFTKKLRLAQYADSTIYNYRLKIAQAVLYLKKLPDDFTQADVDDYLSMLLDRNRYTLSHFKHTVFGLKEYYNVMGLKEPGGLVLPKVRKPKRLPRVLSQEQMKRLISLCELYDKALLSTIYDCVLRVSEVCSLKWIDISFDRQQVFVYQGKGKKDRCVPISEHWPDYPSP